LHGSVVVIITISPRLAFILAIPPIPLDVAHFFLVFALFNDTERFRRSLIGGTFVNLLRKVGRFQAKRDATLLGSDNHGLDTVADPEGLESFADIGLGVVRELGLVAKTVKFSALDVNEDTEGFDPLDDASDLLAFFDAGARRFRVSFEVARFEGQLHLVIFGVDAQYATLDELMLLERRFPVFDELRTKCQMLQNA
jgi:hypothetical protein